MILAGFAGGYIRKRLDKKFGLAHGTAAPSFNRKSFLQAFNNLHYLRLIVKIGLCFVVSIIVYGALKRFPWPIFMVFMVLPFVHYYWKVKKGPVSNDADTDISFENIVAALLTMLLVGIYIYQDMINSSGHMPW